MLKLLDNVSVGLPVLLPVSLSLCLCINKPVAFLRRLQEEEQQLRTSSLPAIPNPFPELCSPASSPVLSPGSLPQCQPSGIYVRDPSLLTARVYLTIVLAYKAIKRVWDPEVTEFLSKVSSKSIYVFVPSTLYIHLSCH